MIPTESQEQITFIQWMRMQYPQHRVIAIPNGGVRNIVTAARLKREGCSAGVPDMFVPSLKLWIELKRVKGGSVSKEQKDWLHYLSECGYIAVVCRGCEEAMNAVIERENYLTRDIEF